MSEMVPNYREMRVWNTHMAEIRHHFTHIAEIRHQGILQGESPESRLGDVALDELAYPLRARLPVLLGLAV